MAEKKTVGDYITDNTLKAYYDLDTAMLKAHREKRHEYAESTARMLLEHADLPLLIRARACMVLGCSEEPDFLEMAAEGVRVAQLGFDLCDNPGEVETQLLEDCKTVYKGAKEIHDQLKEEEEEADEEEEEEEEGGELVWKAGDDDKATGK